MTLQQCQCATTSTEFIEWQDFFAHEMRTPTLDQYYLAQVACEIRRGYVEDPREVKLESFLLTPNAQAAEEEKELTEEQVAAHMQASKSKWLAIARVSRKPPVKKE